MGYENPEKVRVGQSIRFNPVEAGYVHPWSYENLGEQYEDGKLSDFIPLRDYLELPANAVDKIIVGMMKGRTVRQEREEKARQAKAAKDKQQKNTSNVHTDQLDPATEAIIKSMQNEQQ